MTSSIIRYWERYVPHKCMDLHSNSSKMSEDAFSQMTSMIDGGRLLVHSENACYVASPDQVPPNLPFVKRVYTDVSRHPSHQAPLEKTVIEYDKTQMTPDNLSMFWEHWSKRNSCILETKSLRKVLETKKKELENLNNTITTLWGTDADKIDFHAIKTSLSSQKEMLHGIIRDAVMSWSLNIKKVDNLKKEIEALSSRISFLETQNQLTENEIGIHSYKLETCRDQKAKCDKDKGIADARLGVLVQKNGDLRSDISSFDKDIDDLNGQISKTTNQLNTCNYTQAMTQDALSTIQRKLDDYTEQRDRCRQELSEYKVTLQQASDSYNLSNNTYKECKAQAPVLTKNVSTCEDTLRGCSNKMKGLLESDMNVRDVEFNGMMPFFQAMEEKIATLTRQRDELRTSLKQCRSTESSLDADIEELRSRNQIMKDQKALTVSEIEKVQGNVQTTLARMRTRARDASLEQHKSIAYENMQRKISAQCSGDQAQLQAQFNKATNANSLLKNKMKAVTNPQKACKAECEIDLSQCINYAGDPNLCTKRESGGKVQSQPGSETKVEITVYDQENKKIKEFNMSVSGDTECIYRSGAQELSAIEVRNANGESKSNMTLYFKAGSGSCTPNPTPSMFSNPSSMVNSSDRSYLNNDRPALIGGVMVDKTVYRKINLYRGTDSVTFLLA